MIKKNESGKIEIELYDAVTYENGKVICHMKNIEIILSSSDGASISKDDIGRFKGSEDYLEVIGVKMNNDFRYGINCFNSYTLDSGMVVHDDDVSYHRHPEAYLRTFFNSMVNYFFDCTSSAIACYHTVSLRFICDKECININVHPDMVVMVDKLHLYSSIEGFVYEQQFFNDYENSYFVEITNNEA